MSTNTACPPASSHGVYPQTLLESCTWQHKPDGGFCLQNGTVKHPQTETPLLVFGQEAMAWFRLTEEESKAIIRIRFTAKGIPFPHREEVASESDKLQIRFQPETPHALMAHVVNKAREVLAQAGYLHVQYQAHDTSACCGFGCFGCVVYKHHTA